MQNTRACGADEIFYSTAALKKIICEFILNKFLFVINPIIVADSKRLHMGYCRVHKKYLSFFMHQTYQKLHKC